MRTKKGFLAVIMLFALILSGCGGNVESGAVDSDIEEIATEDSDRIKLTLACWVTDMRLEMDVEYFNSIQSEYEAEIYAFYDFQNPSTNYDSAMQSMNVMLATREVADIFYLNSMDVAALVNAGKLANLYPLMEADEDFNSDDYFMNILKLFEREGKLYEYFEFFQINSICGPEPLLGDRWGWTIDEYQEFASTVKTDEGEPVLGDSKTHMMAHIIQGGMQDFIDIEAGTCRFDTPEFKKALNFAATFPERPTEGVLSSAWFAGVDEYFQYKDTNGTAPRYVGFPSNYSAGPNAMAIYCYGISEGSQYKEAAWDYIMAVTDPDRDAPTTFPDHGIPLRKEAFLDELERSMLDTEDENFLMYGWLNAQRKPYEPLTQEDVDYIYNLVSSIEEARFRNDLVYDIILEEAGAFFAGDKTVDETAKLIQSRVSLYLGEHMS